MKSIRWVELFHSFQGEGKHTGASSVFLRLWGCNLKCAGFAQPNPLDKDTWDLTFREYDPKANNVTAYEDLPIFGKGCDSEYAHNAKYKHLSQQSTPTELVEKMLGMLPGNVWGDTHLVITGGESLMRRNQLAFVSLMRKMIDFGYTLPSNVTFETNGTQELIEEFKDILLELIPDVEVSFSVSPKLQNVTGELNEVAIKPDVVETYVPYADHIWIKPVVCDTESCWNELESVVERFRTVIPNVPVYVMPVGATIEEQQQDYVPKVVDKALKLGYHISIRAHVYVFANQVGT